MSEPILIQALQGKKTSRIPFWYMRQAGRYLPEYNQLRRGRTFLDMSTNSDIAFDITVQPHRRFGPDGLILFADILTPLHACGVPLYFEEKKGPVLERTIESAADLSMLESFVPQRDCSYVGDTLVRLRGYAHDCGEDRPAVLGFAGAPFTMASYLIEGGTSKKFEKIRRMMFGEPELFERICNRLVEMTVDYLSYQFEAGAEAVQLFDSWAGILSPAQYEAFAGRYTKAILQALADRGRPVILFVGGGQHLIPEMIGQNPACISLDWRARPEDVAKIPAGMAIQGNLDPLELYGNRDRVRSETQKVLSQYESRPGYVFNLGHGIHPATPLENVQMMIDTVRSF